MNIGELTGEHQGRMNAAMAITRYIRRANPSEQARSSSGGGPRLTMGLLRRRALEFVDKERTAAEDGERYRATILRVYGLGNRLDIVA